MVILIIFSGVSPVQAATIPNTPIDQHPKVTMLGDVGEGKYIDADYSFTPGITDETKVSITPGSNTRLITIDEFCSKAPASMCNSFQGKNYYFPEDTSGERSPSATMTFTDVGIYNNQKIDMMIETTSETY